MSNAKRKIDELEPNAELKPSKREKSEKTDPSPEKEPLDAAHTRSDKVVQMGCSIQPLNRNTSATVGPFVEVIETGDLCFLTIRRIFGPYQEQEKLVGTKVALHKGSDDTLCQSKDICGEVIAVEYSEELDVALVKINKEYVPAGSQFIQLKDEQMKAAGFHTINSDTFGKQHETMDEEELMTQDLRTQRLIKLGAASGLTSGKLHLIDNKPKLETYLVRKEAPDHNFFQILKYKDQFLIMSADKGNFASEADMGAAVYLYDKNNQLRCFGMICQIMDDDKGVLVTPIQNILTHLGRQLGKTLKIAAMHLNDNMTDDDFLDPQDVEVFNHALRQGMEHDRHLRVNIIGFYAQGKTTLTRRLLNEPLTNVESTDGIDIHIRKCLIREYSWEKCEAKRECEEFARRLADVARSASERRTCADGSKSRPTGDDEDLDLNSPLDTQPLVSQSTEHQQPSSDIPKPARTDVPVKDQDFFMQFVGEKEKRERGEIAGVEILATIWDFGGQYIYYATHQMFHSRDAIYLLVFDLTVDLENVIEDEDFPNRQEQMKNSLKFWVNSINAFVGTEDGEKPKIILVGTHKDEFLGNLEMKFNEVKNLFTGTKVRNHIHSKSFAVANLTLDDSTIEELRKTIYRIGTDNAERRRVPAKWLPLEMALISAREKNILNFQDILEMDVKSDLPIKDENEIKIFLKHHHEKGTFVYFDEGELNNYVVINPQFLTDAFKCIITSRDIYAGSENLYRHWKKLKNMAILEKEILDVVWKKDNYFKDYANILLMFLQKHRVIAELLCMDTETGNVRGLERYVVPSLLKKHCSEATADAFLFNKRCTTVLGLDFDNNVVLTIIYERVTAAALGKWPPIEFKGQILVFQNVGYYRLDLQHAALIGINNRNLELQVINQCPKSKVDSKVCDRFRRYVEMIIEYEFRKLHNEERDKLYKHYLKCNHADHAGKGSKNFHYVHDILKSTAAKVCCPDNDAHSMNTGKVIDEWFQRENVSSIQATANAHVTEGDLSKVARAIGKNWEFLGYTLGFTSDEIDRIKIDNGNAGIALAIFTMLKKWKARERKNDNMHFLIMQMRECIQDSVNWDKIRNLFDDF